ncbi:RNA polymerase subunit RP030 [Nile crocodilepox virus]|uniref:DNA-directed RNA polymerase 30 kDa polypeptide n=1 Tax=Nile crocodilepox virus (isolate Crocodylus niloticus/Zimbabwe/Ume/2001) TaxID=1289473 RepID=Q070J5_CPRVZ|nr:RNA polymerase subunit RP030 [Nile crocodilepox virus]ABJ08948.1 RNA polymerase subunit RP030 [Nile crocodilepox virus]
MDKEALRKLVGDNEKFEELYAWSRDTSDIYYLRNIVNSKVNIEETKFSPINNVGIEYSKDAKNRLSYRNKAIIPSRDKRYHALTTAIEKTNGKDRDLLRYFLYGLKCLDAGVEYDLEKLQDYDYDKYFSVLSDKSNTPCIYCRSTNTVPVIAQTRAADEEATVKYVCKNCGKNFSPPKFKYRNEKQCA